LMEHIRNILVAKMVPDADDLIEVSPEELSETKADATRLTIEHIQDLFRIFHQTEEALRSSQHPWFLLEMAVVRASRLTSEATGAAGGKTVTATPLTGGGSSRSRPTSAAREPSPASGSIRSDSAKPQSVQSGGSMPKQSTVEANPPTPSPISPALVPRPTEMGRFPVEQAPFPKDAPVHGTHPPQALSHPPTPSLPGQAPFPTDAPLHGTHPPQARQDAPLPVGDGPLEVDWEAVVDRVNTERPNVGAFLQETALVGIENDTLTIGYPASAGASMKMILKEDYQRAILDACRAVAGRSVRLRVVTLDPGASVKTVAQLRREREEVTAERLRQEALANPLVQEALSVFSGEVKEVRRKHVRPSQESPCEK
jgi:DNA polymerase-3 subunit gamma/tau